MIKPPLQHCGFDALALLAGASLTLAFAPFSIYPLAILAPALLLYSWRDTTSRRAAWRGFLFGLSHFASGVSWVYISLHSYGNAPPVFAASLTLLLIVYMALYPAAVGYGLMRLSPRPGVTRYLLAAPALWVLSEWLRSWLLSGFPWLTLGYSQIDSPLGQLAVYTGVFGVSWAVMLSAGLVALILSYRQNRFRLGWALLLMALWLGALVLDQVQWSSPAGKPLRISMIQGNIEQSRKWDPDEQEKTLHHYSKLSLQVAPHSDVIIWPETAIPTFFSLLDETFLQALRAHAEHSQTDYLSGVAVGDWERGLFHNSVVSISRSPAQAPAFYHKHHLLPFGEYLPFRALFDLFHAFVDIPMADFTPGSQSQPLLVVAHQPVGVSICFEAAFGNEIRRALPAARLLVNVSNDAWFGDSLAPHQHLQIARMRALESARAMARATNTGISALIDYQGTITTRGEQFASTVVQGILQPRQGSTPYVRLGDSSVLILCSLTLLAAALLQRPISTS